MILLYCSGRHKPHQQQEEAGKDRYVCSLQCTVCFTVRLPLTVGITGARAGDVLCRARMKALLCSLPLWFGFGAWL